MEAAQDLIEESMLRATRKKGEEIKAPKRTHYAGKPIEEFNKHRITDPALMNLGSKVRSRIEIDHQ